MSQYPTGQMGPTSAVRQRRVSGDDPRVGQTESLGVFGVTPTMAIDDQGVSSARALMAALGVVDRSLAISAQEVERQRANAEREASENERIFRGIGAERTIEVGPQLLEDVRTGKVRPNEGEDYAAFADRVIRERAALPDDDAATPIAIDEMRKRLSTGIQNEAIRLVGTESEQQRKEMTSLIVSGSVGKSADELRAAIAELRTLNPDASEEALRDTVAVASLQAAALQGNEAAFNEAASLLPENSIERLKARNTLDTTIERQQRQREDAFNTEVAGLYVDLESGNASYEQIRQTIMAARGRVKNDAVIDRELQQLASRERQDLANAYRTALDIENRRLVGEMEGEIATKAIDAFNTGGLANLRDSDLVRTKTVTINGQEVQIEQKITREDAIRVTTERAFAQIDALGLDPEIARDQKIGFLSMNGVAYEPWKRTIEAGYVSNIQSLRARTMSGEKVTELPRSVVDGYTLWKEMDASNPQLLAMHGNEESLRFYRLMDTASKYMTSGDINQAGIMAATTTGRRAFGSISDEMVRKESDWFTGVENENDIGAEIRDLASLMLGSGFAPDPTTAIKEASKQVKASHKKVGGVWVNMSNRNLAPDFEQAADFYLDGWATANGETNDIDRKQITLYPANGSDYYIWDKRGNNALGLVTANDLAIATEQRREQLRQEIANPSLGTMVGRSVGRGLVRGGISALPGNPNPDAVLAGAREVAGTLRDDEFMGALGSAGYRARGMATPGETLEGIGTVRQMAGAAVSAGKVAVKAKVRSWYEQRPGETAKQYTERTGRK